MAEDIDIEEHDLLQNPIIQRIFPDLSVLKQEIMDVDEGFPEKVTNSKETDKNIKMDKNILINKIQFTDNINVSDTTQSHFACSFHRKIILGSKPSKEIKNLTSDLKVMLQNIRPYLIRTKRFCDKCLILFPNKGSLNDHKSSVHTILECNSKQNYPLNPTYKKSYKCSLCQGEYSAKCSLRRHERNIHKIDQRYNKYATTQIIEDDAVEHSFDLQTNYVYREACFHCDELFPNQQDLIDHLYTILYAKKAQIPTETTEKREITQVEKSKDKNKEILQKNVLVSSDLVMENKVNESKSIYSCPICSYYFNEEMFCKNHAMVKHKALKNMQIDKSLFNPMCKFCDLKLDDILSYNTHLRKSHKIEMLKPVNSNNLLLSKACIVDFNPKHEHFTTFVQNSKSLHHEKPIYNNIQILVSKIILFKCSECNINFLTSDAAFKHLEHLCFETNWECTNCHRLFKDKDAKIHQKQHQYSEYFVIIKVLAEVQPTILYKCPMCAVHYSKEKISDHCDICDSEQSRSSDSSYCKFCDIFVESSIKTSHDNDHNLRNFTPSDIEIINLESSVIKNGNKNHNENSLDDSHKEEKSFLPDSIPIGLGNSADTKVDNKICEDATRISKFGVSAKKQLSYNFCNVCKCNISRVFKKDVHLKSLCVNILKYICKFCGLMFSNKSIISHKKWHQQYKTLKLQDITFYSMQTNKIIKPLIPEFPKCELCEKHFISKVEVIGHLCDINDYLICSVCKTKFSESAYKLHIPFHSYKLKNKTNKLIYKIKTCKERNEGNKSISEMDEIMPIIYTCKNCNVSLSTYDDVIEHCHLHTNLNKVDLNGIECAICQLKFDNSSFNKHVELHKDFENIEFTRFNFDVSYFGSNKWLKHIFKSLCKDEVNKLIKDSIYKYETRIKMQVIQEGPSNLTIYKCEKCDCIIDSNSTYGHIVTCCPNSEMSDCTFCDLSFACSVTRNIHEKTHLTPEITVKSYRIVMFNRQQDHNINYNISNIKKCYVLYECRFCHVLVENYDYVYHVCFRNDSKKCNFCGLLICAENLDEHILKHKLIPSFNENKIKVVLLGNKTEENNILQGHNILLPTFNGIVCDYTFYKCIDCEVCIRDARNTVHHSCLIDAAKSQCTKCDLIFDEGKLKGHLKLHDTDPDFTKETILVKPFTNRKQSKNVDKPKKNLAVEIEKNDKNSNENMKHIISNENKITKLYKCSCGVHYVQQSSLQEHIKKCSGKNKSKQSIQICFKCGLSFTSDVLFRHLLEHHGDKNVVFKYEIVENPGDG
ncbi:zinc finger protein 91-like [Maniola hyperantus]|uniref:zinc finger protein 91-like n=1 Tax=Aphantopus hyperantus TaxID=2795564 RepID=UPI0015699083|nr:zinc finger protein 91-like [Maniola hyperantus]